MEGISPLQSVKAGVRLTTAKFYSPKMKAISDGGVVPHVTVQQVSRPDADSGQPIGAEKDVVLAAGTRIARDLVAARQPSETPDRSAQADVRRDLDRAGRGR